jgi:spore maturation protein CgeB
MKILCVFGQYQYGDVTRGISTEYASFVPALTAAGHTVVLFDSWNRLAYQDFAELNAALLETVAREQPNVMLFVPMLAEVWLETLEIIKARGDVISICWTTDDSWKYDQQSRFIASAFHVIATTYPEVVEKYRRDGFEHVFLTQWAAAAAHLAPPLPAAQCRFGVTFVGAMHGNRRERIAHLQRKGVDVECFGYGWPNGPVSSERMLEIIRQSVISLNFANSQGPNQIKARIFEVPGAGGFLLTENAPGLARYYRVGEEIDSFADASELESKARQYLEDRLRRDEMATLAFERTSREHTYERRLKDLLAFASAQKERFDSEGRQPPAPDFPAALAAHRIGAIHQVLRRILLAVTTTLVGRCRGRRMARRALYELSWRFAGAKTYRASGLPGRLFPKD